MKNTNAPRPVARSTGRRITTGSSAIIAAASSPAVISPEPTQPLTRAKVERLAWTLYATAEPAVIELLLLADNEKASRTMRHAADQALEWFNPAAVVPPRPSDFEDPEPIQLLRTALLSGEMQVRIAAGKELSKMLAPSSLWALARRGR